MLETTRKLPLADNEASALRGQVSEHVPVDMGADDTHIRPDTELALMSAHVRASYALGVDVRIN